MTRFWDSMLGRSGPYVVAPLGANVKVTSVEAVIKGSRSATVDANANIDDPNVALISQYNLNGGSAVDTVGGVNGTVVGTWGPNQASMVVGDAGTSMYKDGTTGAHITLPQNNLVHGVAAMTISFYYEPNTDPSNREALFVCGDGSQPLDFSIERHDSGHGGLLRAYHIPSAGGAPSYFESTNGISNSALLKGVAHRITMSLGPAGGKMYLDGVLLATIGDTSGWNNTRTKRIGIWDDATAIPMNGAIDLIRIWRGQLTDSQVAALEPAQSITLPTPPPPVVTGIQPLLPRMDDFLVNDDMTNLAALGSTIKYVHPSVSPGGGDYSIGNPGNFFSALSGGGGTVIVCRQGYYSAPNGISPPSGASATNPFTIVAYPGEWATFCQDIDLTKLPNMPQAPGRVSQVQWQLWNSTFNVWRVPYTASTEPIGSISVQGVWMDQGQPWLLLEYDYPSAMTTFRDGLKAGSTRDSNTAPRDRFSYWGPGVAVGDSSGGTTAKQYLYIRFDRPNWTESSYVDPVCGAWPDDGRWNLPMEGQNGVAAKWIGCRTSSGDFRTGRSILPNPANETPSNNQGDLPSGRNPNNCRIFVARVNSTQFLASGQFVRIGSGINTMGYFNFLGNSRSNVELHRGLDWLQVAFSYLRSTNITVHRRRMFCGTWRLTAGMAAKKYNSGFNGWEPSKRSHNGLLEVANDGSTPVLNVTFDNCTLHGWHEIVVGDSSYNQIRFVNCTIGQTYDEFFQSPNGLCGNWEVGYCYFIDSVYLWSSSGSGGGTQNPFCSLYMHHNICDNRCPRVSASNVSPYFNTLNGGPTQVHRGNNAGIHAQKFYNNTCIQAPDDAPSGSRVGYNADGNNMLFSFGNNNRRYYDEVFNCILVCHDNKRYRNSEATTFYTFSDAIDYGMPVNWSYYGMYRDYNCYSRHGLPVRPDTGAYQYAKCRDTGIKHSGGTQAGTSFNYYRAQPAGEPAGSVYYGSSLWSSVRPPLAMATGAAPEEHSTDANPQLPTCMNFPAERTNYRPQNIAICGASATPPSGTNWWSSPGWTSYGATPVPFNMAPSPWKGALDPNGTTCPVGVINP